MKSRSLTPLLYSILMATALSFAACSTASNSWYFDGIPPRPDALERQPYVIAVTDSSAIVRWRTFTPSTPALRFWSTGDTIPVPLPGPNTDHTVLLRDLSPSTAYTYQAQINDSLWTRPVTFRTFPETGSKEPFTFLVFGDSGTLSSGQLALAQHMNQEQASLIIHTGDVAYEKATEVDLTRKHFHVYAPLVSRTPFFPSLGNHDFETRFGEPFGNALYPPTRQHPSSPFYYSFTCGNVRFIALDSMERKDHDRIHGALTQKTGEQYRWLVGELEAARSDPSIDWTILFFHHSPYSASTGFSGHGSDEKIRAVLTPLVDEYGVNFVFTGHDHDYQRSRSIRGNEVVQDGYGAVYVVSGGGGGKRLFRGTGNDWFTAFSDRVYHYIRVHVNNYTIGLEAIDTTGEIVDSYTVSIPIELRKTPELESPPAAR